jgi:hypothetical protein
MDHQGPSDDQDGDEEVSVPVGLDFLSPVLNLPVSHHHTRPRSTQVERPQGRWKALLL